MTGETRNPMLELFRGMRAGVAAATDGVDGSIGGRSGAIQTRREGRRPAAIATGSPVPDMNDTGARVAALEGVRV